MLLSRFSSATSRSLVIVFSGGEINPLDKYWQAGFYAVFCRSCERRIDNPEAHYRSRINDYRLKIARAAAPR